MEATAPRTTGDDAPPATARATTIRDLIAAKEAPTATCKSDKNDLAGADRGPHRQPGAAHERRKRNPSLSRRVIENRTAEKPDAPRTRRLLAPNSFALGRIMKSTARSRDEEDERERQLAAKKLRELDAKQPRTF
ncbi:hypothetical protein SPRG_12730 [Saprolegnia parasitica CBS 223.65]|uniref:Uncharacterized protein n=1 Tax=Saprolegnia parasitica (strain CBS 223.65) TaxID=695850 RepID=A0A067BV78_SAPPC|nr:hypothetical protein SPRG_12730 [Saprolegnia parasitica CBS 223.65]KDO22449.1 hypothetical protein SPRG_12730 [Saprolegnia parasitica CBS 223.65]|eukprot:XP_012206837.1 hypothetical protein SPRG_12730 [Saprolegnia parasitica CBS 223.65]